MRKPKSLHSRLEPLLVADIPEEARCAVNKIAFGLLPLASFPESFGSKADGFHPCYIASYLTQLSLLPYTTILALKTTERSCHVDWIDGLKEHITRCDSLAPGKKDFDHALADFNQFIEHLNLKTLNASRDKAQTASDVRRLSTMKERLDKKGMKGKSIFSALTPENKVSLDALFLKLAGSSVLPTHSAVLLPPNSQCQDNGSHNQEQDKLLKEVVGYHGEAESQNKR